MSLYDYSDEALEEFYEYVDSFEGSEKESDN